MRLLYEPCANEYLCTKVTDDRPERPQHTTVNTPPPLLLASCTSSPLLIRDDGGGGKETIGAARRCASSMCDRWLDKSFVKNAAPMLAAAAAAYSTTVYTPWKMYVRRSIIVSSSCRVRSELNVTGGTLPGGRNSSWCGRCVCEKIYGMYRIE